MKSQLSFHPNQTFTRNGVSTNFEIIGGGFDCVLFIHGFGLTLHSWEYIKHKFNKKKYKLILIDLKGCGFSDKPKNSDYSINEQANIVLNLLKHLKIKNVKIISHSYGGTVTLYLHYLINKKKYNLNIVKTVLIDVPAYNNFTPFFMKILKNTFLNFVFLKIFPAKFMSKLILKNTFYNKSKAIKKLLPQYNYFFKLRGYDEALTQLSKQLIPNEFRKVIESYSKIISPVLIIWGDNDDLINISQGIQLNKNITNSSFEIIKKCGHVPHEEHPEKTFNLINAFFNYERN